MSSISNISTVSDSSNSGTNPTKITIIPEDGTKAFFGEDGLTFGDVLDTINPLKHIPIISDLMASDTDPKPSIASKLAGGLLFGGPIGFMASLVNEIFEEATGKGVIGAAYAALSGEPSAATTQVATAAPQSEEVTEQVAQADTNPEINSISTANTTAAAQVTHRQTADAGPYADIARRAQLGLLTSSPASITSGNDATKSDRDRALLSLYGKSTPSVHNAYQKAQLLPYLQQVNTTQVM